VEDPCPAASILIVDDFAEWRAQVREMLEERPEWQIVAEACDGCKRFRERQELHPDLILLDIGMPVLSGIEAVNPHPANLTPIQDCVFESGERC